MSALPAVSAQIIEQFVDLALLNDATLVGLIPDPDDASTARIYESMLPQATNETPNLYPAIIYDFVSASPDTMAEGGFRIMQTLDYMFKVIGRGTSRGALVPIFQRMDAIISNSAPRLAGGQILQCLRQSEWYPPVAMNDGIPYTSIGGRYRFCVLAYAIGSTGPGPWIGPGQPSSNVAIATETFVAGSGQTAFGLQQLVLSGNPIAVFVNDAIQQPVTDFTTSTVSSKTVVNFGSAVPTGASVLISYAYSVFG